MDCGCRLTVGWPDGLPPGEKATVAVRPEQCTIIGNLDDGHVEGIISQIVYVGTDTHAHLKLDSGEPFVVRQPNRRAARSANAEGQRVGVLIADHAAQVVRD